jgi:CheY-like chemotaxis protein
MASKYDGGMVPLLHIDDSADDRLFVREAISLTQTPFTLYEADGLEAAIPYFQFHKHDGEPEQYPRPALVLLDYNLGERTGVDFLYWLRVLKRITDVPVVVFSGSAEHRDIEECYANGADHFVSKASDLTRLKVIVRSLHLSFANVNGPGPLILLPEYRADPRDGVHARKQFPTRFRTAN